MASFNSIPQIVNRFCAQADLGTRGLSGTPVLGKTFEGGAGRAPSAVCLLACRMRLRAGPAYPCKTAGGPMPVGKPLVNCICSPGNAFCSEPA